MSKKDFELPQRRSQRARTGADLLDEVLTGSPNTGPASTLPLNVLEHYGNNPRRDSTTDESISDMTASLRKYGQVQPLTVRPLPGGRYEVIAGNRRLAAMRQEGWTEAAVFIRDLTDDEAFAISLVENLQRKDLEPIDDFDATLALVRIQFDLDSDAEAAQLIRTARNAELSKSRTEDDQELLDQLHTLFEGIGLSSVNSFWSNRRFMFDLPTEVSQALRSRGLNLAQAKLLARIKNDELRNKLLHDTLAGQLTGLDLEKRIREHREAGQAPDVARTVKTRLTKSRIKKLTPDAQAELNELLERVAELLE